MAESSKTGVHERIFSMAIDSRRLSKIASNISEEERLKQLGSYADTRRDIEETLGTDIIDQEKLERIAEAVWNSVPPGQRPGVSAQAWQQAIYDRCSSAIGMAERRLYETRIDDRFFAAKQKILHATFSNQVVRAMTSVANRYRGG